MQVVTGVALVDLLSCGFGCALVLMLASVRRPSIERVPPERSIRVECPGDSIAINRVRFAGIDIAGPVVAGSDRVETTIGSMSVALVHRAGTLPLTVLDLWLVDSRELCNVELSIECVGHGDVSREVRLVVLPDGGAALTCPWPDSDRVLLLASFACEETVDYAHLRCSGLSARP